MEKKISITLSAGKAVVCLLLGTVLLFQGFYMVVGDGIALTTGKGAGNLSGLAFIIGLILLSFAQSLLTAFVSHAHEFNRHFKGAAAKFTSKQKIYFVLFVITVLGCAAFYAVWKVSGPRT